MTSDDGKKELRPPYASKVAVASFFEKIQGLKAPGTIDRAWAKNYDLDPKIPAAIPGMLKWLKVIDGNGTTDPEIWTKLRVTSSRAEMLEGLMKKAYKAVFDSLDLDHAAREHIDNAFMQAYGTGNTSRPVGCFLALCEHANINFGGLEQQSASGQSPSKKATGRKPSTKKPTARKREPRRRRKDSAKSASSAGVKLNVEIPAGWSEEQVRERLEMVARLARESGLDAS